MCFWKWGYPEYKFTFLVTLGTAILHQVCRVHEILPLWFGTCQWTVKYNFLYWKINPDRISVHIVGASSPVALEQNEVQATLATLLVHSQSGRMKRRVKLTRIGFGLVVVHRSTLNKKRRCWFVFVMCFLKFRLFCVVMPVSFWVDRFWVKWVIIPKVISEPYSTLFHIVKWT